MDEIDLLPATLRSLSLSDEEIVLPYDEALQAIDLLVHNRWALLVWEGWVKYPLGIGHHKDYQGTASLEQLPTETWDAFVYRSANVCRQTIAEDQQRFDADPACHDKALFFCLTALPPGTK